MNIQFERDDSGIKVHERGVIARLCSLFRSHEQGLPEWFKNSSASYARLNLPTEHRVITLLMGTTPEKFKYIALLDHGGMSVEDLEQRFANWGDPEAHLAQKAVDEIVEGGHGHGGKCYMTQMFGEYSYIHTVRSGRGSRYGFVRDDPHPGYFPTKPEGRGFPVERASDELKRALGSLGVDFARLPEEIRTAAAARDGFTLVVGIGPKQLGGKEVEKTLLDSVVFHPQMAITTEKNRIFVIVNDRPLADCCPVTLPEIQPHEYAPEPKVIEIPEHLEDPVTGESCETTAAGAPPGQLILRTSKKSMRWTLKSRHHIRYLVNRRPIAFLKMENVSRSTWVDRMYGECHLNAAGQFETPDRTSLADSPITRALELWIKRQVLAYESEFKKKEHLTASQAQQNRLKEINDLLNRWKNRFLDHSLFGAGPSGGTEGQRRPTRRRPLPQLKPTVVNVKSLFHKAGIGVWLRLQVEFRDANVAKVAPPAYLWHSDDWAVATVDENRIVTHAPGEVEIWLETLDGELRSDPVRIEVLDILSCRVEPEEVDLKFGQIRQLTPVVTDRDGNRHTDVYMTWLQDDSSVVYVSAFGKVIAQKQGETRVYAGDDRCMNASQPTEVKVSAADILPGDEAGRSYPKILLSEVDIDPLNPDGETVHLVPEDGLVHQPTPQHVEHNIWWINLQAPLARHYFEKFGPDSREWRSYHLERFIEALVKIHLSYDFQISEEELTFDEIERRWREIASDVQRRALKELEPLLSGAELAIA